MAEKPRRQRAAEIQLYRPPKARPSDEQKKKFNQIVDFVDETLNNSDVVETKPRVVNREPKRRDKRQKAPSGPQTPASQVANGATSIEVPTPEEGAEIIKIELKDRIFGSHEDALRIADVIDTTKTDCFIISSEGRGVATYTELLKLMGPYFSCTLQDGWAEMRRKVIKTKIPTDTLQQVVEFLHRGEIKLSASNLGSIYVVAEYLQIECLMGACRNFVSSRMELMFDKAIALGLKHVGMASLAEAAIDYVSENLSSAADKLISVQPDLIMTILSRDELNVKSEDEVCDFVVKWLQQGRDHETIKLMIECVRLPHLSERSFNKLCEALKDGQKLPLIEAVKSNKFADLSEDQLARRLNYDRHIHSMWVESKNELIPKYFHLDENLGYRVECLQSRNEKVVSTELLHSFRDFRKHRTSFEFVPIMNSLAMITHSKFYDFILIYTQQPDGRWAQRVKYRRQEPVPEFASSVFGSELHLCIFNGFNRPLKTLRFQPLSFTDAEVVDYEAPVQLFLSPPRMIFREDFVIYMIEDRIEIFDRATNECGTIKLQAQEGTKLTKIKFTDVLVYEDKLYAYEEPPIALRDDDFQVINDRLYVICLKKREIETIVNIVFPRFRRRASEVLGGKNYRSSKMNVVGSRLVLHKYFSTHDSSMIVEFDPEKNVFNKVAEIPCSDGATYYKKLLTLLPVHLHHCKYETLLQKYCNSVRDPARAAELDKLLFYL